VKVLYAAIFLTASLFAQNFVVYRSTDQGATWTNASSGLSNSARVNAFTVSNSIYLAATDQGIYLSRNEANSWELAHPGARILSLAASGANVYAGTDHGGLLRSNDSGLHWQLSAAPFRYVRSLAAHQGIVYAGTDSQGVFASADNGHTWQPLSSGLPQQSQIFSMVVHNGALHAALYRNGLYRFEARLKIWTKVGNLVPLALASSGRALFAGHNPGGIYQTNEPDANWVVARLPYAPNLGNAPVWELAANNYLALAGVSSYIYRSIDHGQTWTAIQNGIPLGASGIAFLTNPRLALAGVSLPSK
jgi:photosystem II stability/assembly factor-like uncharacterized protein